MGNTVARSHIRDADRGVAKATRANTRRNSAFTQHPASPPSPTESSNMLISPPPQLLPSNSYASPSLSPADNSDVQRQQAQHPCTFTNNLSLSRPDPPSDPPLPPRAIRQRPLDESTDRVSQTKRRQRHASADIAFSRSMSAASSLPPDVRSSRSNSSSVVHPSSVDTRLSRDTPRFRDREDPSALHRIPSHSPPPSASITSSFSSPNPLHKTAAKSNANPSAIESAIVAAAAEARTSSALGSLTPASTALSALVDRSSNPQSSSTIHRSLGRIDPMLSGISVKDCQTARTQTPPRVDKPPRARKFVSFNENVHIVTYPYEGSDSYSSISDTPSFTPFPDSKQPKRRGRSMFRLLSRSSSNTSENGSFIPETISGHYENCFSKPLDLQTSMAYDHLLPSRSGSADSSESPAHGSPHSIYDSSGQQPVIVAYESSETRSSFSKPSDPIEGAVVDDYDYADRRDSEHEDTLSLSDAHPSCDGIDEPEALVDQLFPSSKEQAAENRVNSSFDIAPLWQRLKRVDELDAVNMPRHPFLGKTTSISAHPKESSSKHHFSSDASENDLCQKHSLLISKEPDLSSKPKRFLQDNTHSAAASSSDHGTAALAQEALEASISTSDTDKADRVKNVDDPISLPAIDLHRLDSQRTSSFNETASQIECRPLNDFAGVHKSDEVKLNERIGFNNERLDQKDLLSFDQGNACESVDSPSIEYADGSTNLAKAAQTHESGCNHPDKADYYPDRDKAEMAIIASTTVPASKTIFGESSHVMQDEIEAVPAPPRSTDKLLKLDGVVDKRTSDDQDMKTASDFTKAVAFQEISSTSKKPRSEKAADNSEGMPSSRNIVSCTNTSCRLTGNGRESKTVSKAGPSTFDLLCHAADEEETSKINNSEGVDISPSSDIRISDRLFPPLGSFAPDTSTNELPRRYHIGDSTSSANERDLDGRRANSIILEGGHAISVSSAVQKLEMASNLEDGKNVLKKPSTSNGYKKKVKKTRPLAQMLSSGNSSSSSIPSPDEDDLAVNRGDRSRTDRDDGGHDQASGSDGDSLSDLDLDGIRLPSQDDLSVNIAGLDRALSPLAGVYYGTSSPSIVDQLSHETEVGPADELPSYPEYEVLKGKEDSVFGSDPDTPVLADCGDWGATESRERGCDLSNGVKENRTKMRRERGRIRDPHDEAGVPEVLLHEWSGTTPVEPNVEMEDSVSNSRSSSLHMDEGVNEKEDTDVGRSVRLSSKKLGLGISKLYERGFEDDGTDVTVGRELSKMDEKMMGSCGQSGNEISCGETNHLSDQNHLKARFEKGRGASEQGVITKGKIGEVWASLDYEAEGSTVGPTDDYKDRSDDGKSFFAPLPKGYAVDQKLHDFQLSVQRKSFSEIGYRRLGRPSGRGTSFVEHDYRRTEDIGEDSTGLDTRIVPAEVKAEVSMRRRTGAQRRRRMSNVEISGGMSGGNETPAFRGVVGRLVSGMHMAKKLVTPN